MLFRSPVTAFVNGFLDGMVWGTFVGISIGVFLTLGIYAAIAVTINFGFSYYYYDLAKNSLATRDWDYAIYYMFMCIYSAGMAFTAFDAYSNLQKYAEESTKNNTQQDTNLLQANTKQEAKNAVSTLPSNIQKSVKDFFNGGSNKYTDFSVTQSQNGNYLISMTKPGNVPGSYAVYNKIISSDGVTLDVYKITYAPDGSIVHIKDK